MKTLSFTEAVLAERALLALRDPAGELEAVAPMHRDQAEYHLWLNGGSLRPTSFDVGDVRHLSRDTDLYTGEERSGPPCGGAGCIAAADAAEPLR